MSQPGAKRSLRGAAIAVACACLAGPAAAGANEDRARDFTQDLPGMERSDRIAQSGHAEFETGAIRAPARFDMVGVARERDAVEIRVRERGGWSEWVETENGDPLYTGGSRVVQVRSHERLGGGELHYVSLPEPGPLPVAMRSSASERRGGVPKPKFVGRRQWGADERRGGCIPRDRPTKGRVKAGVIHHTVTANDYSEAEAPGIVLGICRFHRNANGWDDIGYNALVDRFGNLYEGRGGGVNRAIVGAQAEGHNLQTAGVASIGDHRSEAPTGPAKRAIVRYLAWRLDLAGIEAIGKTWLTSSGGQTTRTDDGDRIRVNRILSHSDINFTECAGTLLRAKLAAIRRSVQAKMDEYGDGGGEPAPPDEGSGGTAP